MNAGCAANRESVSEPVLCASRVSKTYGERVVLDSVDFAVERGKVNVLIGANGAGKSTLMKILAGVEMPTSGQLVLEGRPCAFASTADAEAAGIGIVHQELRLFPNLSISDNIFLGSERKRHGVLVDVRSQEREARELLRQLGQDIDPRTMLEDLPLGKQQLVEIARALAQRTRVLFLDEPTSALSAKEVATLFDVLRSLKARGVSLVYVSHRLEELLRIGDRITVLRDGRKVAAAEVAEIDAEWIVRHMLGSSTESASAPAKRVAGSEVLRVVDLDLLASTDSRASRRVSFSLHAGEVIGVYGLLGAGRTELLETIAGLRRARGQLIYQGQALGRESLLRRLRRGILLVPEDRKSQGFVPLSVRENVTLSSLGRVTRGCWIDARAESAAVKEMTDSLGVQGASSEQPVSQLSGGNQQKVILSRALYAKPKVLLLDEPTRGIDVAAKAQILRLIDSLAAEGMAILLVSSEARELLDCADRILVLSRGCAAALVPRSTATEGVLMRAAGRSAAEIGSDS
jgi:erythritol transport system ATP-binding protein